MNISHKLKQFISIPTNIYLLIISCVGIANFVLNYTYENKTSTDWVLLYALTGAVVLLNYVVFRLPPEGNSQSLDSTIYLACIFTFGLDLTLEVLAISSLIHFFYNRETEWWKQVFNFSVYGVMITCTYTVFIQAGGEVGALNTQALLTYILALVAYFGINLITYGLYFLITLKKNLWIVLHGILKETITEYVIMLLFSLVLCMMIQTHLYFGLALFIIVAVLLSISIRQLFELYQQVSDKAIRDQRTGLYNHGYFEELLEDNLVQAKKMKLTFSLIIIDLDNFKKYNDTFGHLKGDKLLEFFGRLLSEECQSTQHVVARYGGDEFSILLPQKQAKEAFDFINHLRKKINDTYFEGVEIFPHGCLSFSAGVTEYRLGILDRSELMEQADRALYYAKAQGRNLAHIYSEQAFLPSDVDIELDVAEFEQQLKIFLSKDVYTFQHSKRVFGYAIEICKYIPLSLLEQRQLILGSLVHDIGKLEVPKYILQKKAKLTEKEWELVKAHVTNGKDILAAMGTYTDIQPLVELHHERYDGRGYPYGLKGEEIPKLARILCVIDSFDAMTTERPYQATKSFQEAVQELRRCSGTQFDPEYVEAFIRMIQTKYDFKLGQEETEQGVSLDKET